jgi:hypothetical protein
MMTLLATDPATTPDTKLGRLFFGVVVGMSYPIYSHLLRGLGQPDDFAKILSVPIANLFTPQFDAAARRVWPRIEATVDAWRVSTANALRRQLGRVATRVAAAPNAAFAVTWVVLFIAPQPVVKPRYFEPSLHWTWGTPFVVRDADDVPRCAHNPVFCRPFSFVGEAALWMNAHATHASTSR